MKHHEYFPVALWVPLSWLIKEIFEKEQVLTLLLPYYLFAWILHLFLFSDKEEKEEEDYEESDESPKSEVRVLQLSETKYKLLETKMVRYKLFTLLFISVLYEQLIWKPSTWRLQKNDMSLPLHYLITNVAPWHWWTWGKEGLWNCCIYPFYIEILLSGAL